MPVGLALPLGSADHWVVSDPCPGREHNAIRAMYPSPSRDALAGYGRVVRQTQTVKSGRPRRHPPYHAYACAAQRARALLPLSSVSGLGLHHVGADVADPRAHVALNRL
jgi:hypothetical protein